MRSLRTALGAGLLLLACGVLHHDVTISTQVPAGGGPPTITANIDSATITNKLSASAGDLDKLQSVTLQSVHLSSTDGQDVSFVATATLTLTATGLPPVTLATLHAPAPAGQNEVALDIDGRDLKAYLAAGGTVTASLGYAPVPVSARVLNLTMVIRGTL